MEVADFEESELFGEADAGAELQSDSEQDENVGNGSDCEHGDELDPSRAGILSGQSGSAKSSDLRLSLEELQHSSGRYTSPTTAIPQQAGHHQIRGLLDMHQTSRLGSSAPINIPGLNSWRSLPGGGGGGGRVMASSFVPPHKLSQTEDIMLSLTSASPGASVRKDRLRTRNAILRRTGFLEPLAASPTVSASCSPGQSPAPRAHSTLTKALHTIGEMDNI